MSTLSFLLLRKPSLLIALLLWLPTSGSTASPSANASAALNAPLPGGSVMAVGLDRFKNWYRVRRFFLDPHSERFAALRPWVAWAQTLRRLPERDRLIAIDSQVDSSIAYAEDDIVWHRPDYWENPLEVVRQGRTDCEGYVILKMFLAVSAGIDRDRMAIVVGRVPDRGFFHAVLVVRVGAERYLLDNLDRSPMAGTGGLPDFEAIYAVDMARAWSFPSSPAPSSYVAAAH